MGGYSLKNKDHELREYGWGQLSFINVGEPATVVPVGDDWTLLKVWTKNDDTFMAATADALNEGRVQRHPRRYWGAIETSAMVQVTDTGSGGAGWEVAIVLGLDLVTNPTSFAFDPLPVLAETIPQNDKFTIVYPNTASIPVDFAPFAGRSFFDAGIVGRHDDNQSRTLTIRRAISTLRRNGLLGNPL